MSITLRSVLSVLLFFSVSAEAANVSEVLCSAQLRRGTENKAQKLPEIIEFETVQLTAVDTSGQAQNQTLPALLNGQVQFDFAATDIQKREAYTVILNVRLLSNYSRWSEESDKLEVTASLYKKGATSPLAFQVGHSDQLLSPLMLEWVTGQKSFRNKRIGKAIMLVGVPSTLGRIQTSVNPEIKKSLAAVGLEQTVEPAVRKGIIGEDEATFVDVVCMIQK